MAKFTNKDLRLKDEQKVTWGDSLDANMWWDGVSSQLKVDTTISGITPTEGYHLATKNYIDEELSTLSGGIVQSHDSLTGLNDDDHTQYILVDGSRPFSSTVGGVTPTLSSHLTTKGYVDLAIQGLDWQTSVKNFWTASTGLPGTPTLGVRYIAGDSGNGWTIHRIYTWDSAAWVETVPNEGFSTWIEDLDANYVFNGTIWVKFGSTVTHNNTSGLQGGTTDEYYHLTDEQHNALTSTSGIGDASLQHTHNSIYYTEGEIDSTISGLEADITTYSDHGNLNGLGDDDHTQYVLVDGSRGFTSTVSGVSPINDYDLATKAYVDGEGTTLRGRTAISDGASTVTVNFSNLGHTNYTVNVTMENLSDSPPSIYAFTISAKTASSFTVIFTGDMDSANYFIDWMLIED